MNNTREEYLEIYENICGYLTDNSRKSKAMDLLENAYEVIENAVYDLDDNSRAMEWMRKENSQLQRQVKVLTLALEKEQGQ
jgi:hypothetical protein